MTVIVAGGTTALESLVVGAKAWMTGLNNIIPELAMSMYKLAIVENNWTAARKAYFEKILPLQDCLKAIGKPVPVVKYALELRGFQVGQTRKPLSPLSEKQKEAVRKTLEVIGIL
jgi:dihydrodipicolinate synthase/N-acetylneuraminate lyase